MEWISNIWDWCMSNLFWIVLTVFIIWERKTLFYGLFLEPIRGGNGKTQMNELAEWVLIWTLVYMVHLEGQSAEQVFPVSWGWAMLGGIFLIAGHEKIVDRIAEVLVAKFKNQDNGIKE